MGAALRGGSATVPLYRPGHCVPGSGASVPSESQTRASSRAKLVVEAREACATSSS